jgi:hypothetical protein
VAIWYILWSFGIFSLFWSVVPIKNLATLITQLCFKNPHTCRLGPEPQGHADQDWRRQVHAAVQEQVRHPGGVEARLLQVGRRDGEATVEQLDEMDDTFYTNIRKKRNQALLLRKIILNI